MYLLERAFLPFEVQKIKSIPLCLIPQEDILIWPKTKDGQYSVKLGYQLLCAKELSGLASGSSNEVNRRLWSGLWRMKVPSKVKTFAWRACSESLPTMVNLARRRVVLSSSCTGCNRGSETVFHALWGCEKVKGAWGTNFDELRSATNQNLFFVDLFRLALQNPRGAEAFIMICWSIWNRRNKIRVKEVAAPLEKIPELAQKQLMDFQQLCAKPESKTLARKVTWIPPDAALLKTNFDGAVFDDLGAAGIGVVVRNSRGEVLAALSEVIPLPSSIVALETMAARRAALFVRELGFSGAIFEGDSEESILAIKKKNFQHPVVGHLVQDIMSSVSMFQYYSFSHTRRHGNVLAHALARRARLSFPTIVWMNTVPADIYRFFVSDIPVIK